MTSHVKSDAVVLNRENQIVSHQIERQIDPGGAGVARQIRERFLRSAVHQDFDIQVRLIRQSSNAERSLETLGNPTDLPQLS